MLVKLTLTASLLMGTAPTSCDQPPVDEKPDCPGQAVLVDYDWDGDCDVTPPQSLSIVLPDAGDGYLQHCLDMGGQVLISRLIDEVLCLHVDY